MWRRSLLRLGTNTVRIVEKRLLNQRQLNSLRFITSQVNFEAEKEPKPLRLWSDSGGDDVTSSPFDDLGAWHDAEAKSFLHNVSIDSVGFSCLQGKKSVNEDRYKLLELDPDFYYFAVFDGHGGSVPADFAQDRLHQIIQRLHRENKDLEKVLVQAFEECDYELEKHIKWLVTEKGEDPSVLRGGTTATVVLLRDGTDLAIASAGDSRAVLCRDGNTTCVTRDHHPLLEEEQRRITASNGTIDSSFSIPRVNGRLAMTRSLGDFDVKPYGVIPTPETTLLKVEHNSDAFIVLITDGISNVISTYELGFLVRMCADPLQAAHSVTCCAIQYGSEDNVTSMVVPLRAWRKFCGHSFVQRNIMRVNCI